MTQTRWQDPPPIGGPQDPRSAWIERLRPLKEHPMRWALLASGTPSAMHQRAGELRQRTLHVPSGGWEFRVRKFRRGEHVYDQHTANLYGRFLGEEVVDQWDRRPRDEDGRLICPHCSELLEITPGHTRCPTHGFWLNRDRNHAGSR